MNPQLMMRVVADSDNLFILSFLVRGYREASTREWFDLHSAFRQSYVLHSMVFQDGGSLPHTRPYSLLV